LTGGKRETFVAGRLQGKSQKRVGLTIGWIQSAPRLRLISYFDEEMQIPANPFLTCPTQTIVLCFFTTKIRIVGEGLERKRKKEEEKSNKE